ncbi:MULTISPECIES: AbrB/MazE/SpoVT family DNA-binding domain-containing protein [unclassified Shinella]|uniref:AbrB/MazE/SpoVT family DNA-binding domain-containing protein n=1 Tax=Shinella TaxID=323620 RepID=UPI00225D4950|nr:MULTISPECIES: AbrB/MazE/SpoVT family DNA-binding domain-containing protein [unclassified Shinella]CAI0337016.1 putative addiction module antidote [Rhizobiaceae bacterium]CAK7255541.1 antitoxin MazE [Shinella sp. WSC3-e]MCO5136033.1 AbrB/MazE/SpoVT family DNA-binding domain-containing protein [Shinella sp.]MCW5710518.1 AbrB/MazE/SpoVT family DNA-binding domain-containing protein [Shinella sp.]MDC7254330.1 AbrB/MazE/SpoVT family DNA-binding domain-containing protein [Shinella sp. YE25]
MNVTIRKIGNSEGIIIPKDVLDRMGVKAGDEITMTSEGSKLILSVADGDFERQLGHAEKFMDRYKVALKKLAE